jgi:FlaA1/EpsC-like NDP-sugar epimerase
MIHLMGLTEKTEDRPNGDIEIVYTGLRPGEKLYEELLIGDDPQGTSHPRIMMAREVSLPWGQVEELLSALTQASHAFDCKRVIQILKEAKTGYTPNGDTADLVWCNGVQNTPPAANEGKVLHLN